MESLTKTPFFFLLMQKNEVPTIAEFSQQYKDFLYQLTRICTCKTRNIPAFFTLTHTHIELISLKKEYKAIGMKKK